MATNLEDLTAIRTRFLDQWDSSVTVLFDNDTPVDDPRGAIWAMMNVRPFDERRRSIAARTYEVIGRIYLKVIVPVGFEDRDGWTLAELFGATFRDWNSNDYRIRCDTPNYTSGTDEDGDFYILTSIPYTAQH